MPLTEQQQQDIRDAAYHGATKAAQELGLMAGPETGTEKICRMIAAAQAAAVNAYDGMVYGDDDGGY